MFSISVQSSSANSGLSHCLMPIMRKSKIKIGDYIHTACARSFNNLADVDVLKAALRNFLPHVLASCFNTHVGLVYACLLKHLQIFGADGIDARICPNAKLQTILSDTGHQRLIVVFLRKNISSDIRMVSTPSVASLSSSFQINSVDPNRMFGDIADVVPSVLSTRFTILIMQKLHLNLHPSEV